MDRHNTPKDHPDAASPTATVIAYLESLQQEYNQLSARLMAQTQHKGAAGGYQALGSTSDCTVDVLSKRVKFLTQQLKVLTQDKASLEKALHEQRIEHGKEVERLKQEALEWKEDVGALKDILKRLNEQLNRYHLQHGRLPEEVRPLQHETKLSEQDISRSSIHKLSAVLMAYDELLLERDTTIKNNTAKLENLMVRVEAVTSENEDLHSRLEKMQAQAPLGSEEADLVASDAKLLLEERELLLKELQTLRRQRQQETSDHQQEVRRVQQKLDESESHTGSLVAEVETWKQECESLEDQCRSLQEQLRGSVTRDEHQLAVDECRSHTACLPSFSGHCTGMETSSEESFGLFEELRMNYNHESGTLKSKVQAARHEKHDIAEKLTDTSTQAQRLSVQVSGLKGSLRRSESKIQRRERSLKALQAATRLAQSRLKSLTQVCSELLEDREKLLKAFVAQRNETEELSKEVTLRSAAVGALSQKLKEERQMWTDRMAESEGALKAAQSAWKRSSREANHLRTLVTTKDDTIASLIADVKSLNVEQGEAKQSLRQQFLKHQQKFPKDYN